jgi:hypothetical protein
MKNKKIKANRKREKTVSKGTITETRKWRLMWTLKSSSLTRLCTRSFGRLQLLHFPKEVPFRG